MNDPGQLNRRLVLEAPIELPDGAGGVTRSFAAVATLWASVMPRGAERQVEAQRLGARITHRLRIRFRDDITTRHRLREDARIYHVDSLRDPDGRKRFLLIEAEERVD